MTALLSAADVAERLGVSENLVKRMTAAEDWPCVRLSKRTIRYRAEHVDQIVAMHESKSRPVAASSGQTARSRRRAS